MEGVEHGKQNGLVHHTPAENYVPRFDNAPTGQKREVEMQLALTDPDFRERAEAFAVLLNDPEYRDALRRQSKRTASRGG